MRILVTGGDGQLGRSLVERAAARNDIVVIAAPRADTDITDINSLSMALRGAEPDLVINAAAFTAVDAAEDAPEQAMQVNRGGAAAVAGAARTAGAALIHISTDYVFNGEKATGYREEDPIDPIGVYGRTKAEGEAEVRRIHPTHLIIRTAWVYSPFGHNFVRSIMAAAETRETLTVVDDQIGNPTSALDLASALLDLARKWRSEAADESGTFHLAGSGSASWCALARRVMEECSRQGLPSAEVQPIGSGEWPTRARRPACSVLDSARIRERFGIALPRWQDGVAEVVERIARERWSGGRRR